MAKEEAVIQNFSGGELSPQMAGRFELAIVKSGCRKLRNMISEVQGSARFRNGFRVTHYTRENREAFPVLFQFNKEQAYVLEFTHKKLRFYKDDGIIVEAAKTISGITSASPGVVTATGHGYVTGDEIIISGVFGFNNLNGVAFTVVRIDANTFSLKDIDGVAVNTTAMGTYISGGTASRVYEIATPYDEALDLSKLKVTQNADTMYLDHAFYEPRKLTRTAHTSWTLSLYTRTDDPFTDKKVISAATKANPGQLTSTSHGYVTGDIIIIEGIVGMVELNSRPYTVVKVDANNFTLKDYVTGVAVDTSGYTTYTSDGYASLQELLPTCPMFYEGRLYHAGMAVNPTQFIGSMSPVPTTGVPRYDVYTAGADPDDAVYFSIADGEVNYILWLIGTNRLMMAGTFGTEVKITGETVDKPVTPSSVNVKAENRLGVADIYPINKENIVIYVQKNGLTVRTFTYDALNDKFISDDKNLVSEHVTKGGIVQMTWQSGRPDIVWMVRNDGALLGMTFKAKEEIAGWHIHDTGKDYGDKFLRCVAVPRSNKHDRLWAVTERVVGGKTRRFMEYMEDKAEFPDRDDFYTAEANKVADTARYQLAMLEAQKAYMHLDCALSYDGSLVGVNADATLTPSSTTGNSITISSDNAVFFTSDVGREIWKKSIDGSGEGRAKILNYVSATSVICQVIHDFDSVTAIAPGDWFLTTNRLSGLGYMEGRTLSVVADGSVHTSETVTDGFIDLEYQAGVVHVGLPYFGFLSPMSVEGGGTTGPAVAKSKVVSRVGIRFLETLGAEYGSDIYNSERVDFTEMPLQTGGPPLLFTGVKDVHLTDSWDVNKTIFVRQPNPLPCTIQFLELWLETDNIGS